MSNTHWKRLPSSKLDKYSITAYTWLQFLMFDLSYKDGSGFNICSFHSANTLLLLKFAAALEDPFFSIDSYTLLLPFISLNNTGNR